MLRPAGESLLSTWRKGLPHLFPAAAQPARRRRSRPGSASSRYASYVLLPELPHSAGRGFEQFQFPHCVAVASAPPCPPGQTTRSRSHPFRPSGSDPSWPNWTYMTVPSKTPCILTEPLESGSGISENNPTATRLGVEDHPARHRVRPIRRGDSRMHRSPPTRLTPRPFSGLGNRIQRSPTTAVASQLQGEHGKRGSQNAQAGYGGPEATPTPRRLAVVRSMSPRPLKVTHRCTG